jgi:hypothetical protein
MNNTNRWAGIVVTLLLVAAAGFFAYNAGLHNGMAQGIAQSGKLAAPMAGAPPYPYPPVYPYWGWHRPWSPGFVLIPVFFVLWIVAARGLFWRRRFGFPYGGYGGPGDRLDEWHRRAHERWNDSGPGAPVER